ncbi:kinase-like protein [Pseudovirgaria hyperparasitica]|uniref:Kinase-like protein n=1 Tax=Pseudovirgaria hyperparasitica TaxID=470096 RepID=A0A6A6WC97_9PEZI|nr:kinase-like protein [Pseudovirgaria hyperparasitica]KAF2759187.1 kinase-like protein [Pseudovirgaria hyperparasitica]
MLTHRHIRDGHAHFDEYENLGRGGSASVERVRHKLSGLFFARKKILRGNNIATQQRKLEEFERELKALQRLRHKHLVSYVGSYTDLWSFSLILTPVAELELKTLLERQAKEPLLGEEVNWLRNAFGCIASALSYCHENRFRHKDIKPGNILLNDGQIYLCDFGISHDWNDLPTATTTGDPGKFTLRYCAPEVVNRQSRNEKSDVWSLACVYIEMISVIKGHSLQDLDRFLLNENSPSVDYWCQPEAAKAWLDHIRDGSPDDVALDWIEKMVSLASVHFGIPFDHVNSSDRILAIDRPQQTLSMTSKLTSTIPQWTIISSAGAVSRDHRRRS